MQRLEQCVLHSPDDVQHQNSMAEALEQLGVRWEDEKKNKWTTRLQTSALVRKGFCKFFFGIDLNSGINGQGSKLIHPNSPFINGVNTISIFVLFYILIVVQVEIGFYWMKSPCYLLPTYHFDMAIDVWFIFEMVLSFFTGMYVQGVYNDSFRNVARAYLRGTFLFDCLTAVPVSIIDYALRQQYCVMGMTADGLQELVLANEPPDLSWLRIFKPLRLVKLTRLLKTLPMVLVLIDAVEKLLRIPVFLSRLFRLLVAIIFTVHTVSCLFWLVKESSARDMVEVESWLLANGLPVDAPLLDKYMVAAYFITTVFTTVGFGDIAAENTQERVFSIAAMYVGVVVFGTLLSEVQNAIGDMFEYQRQRVRMVQQLKDFLYVNGVEHSLADLILSWVEFDFSYRQEQVRVNVDRKTTERHITCIRTWAGVATSNGAARARSPPQISSLASTRRRPVQDPVPAPYEQQLPRGLACRPVCPHAASDFPARIRDCKCGHGQRPPVSAQVWHRQNELARRVDPRHAQSG